MPTSRNGYSTSCRKMCKARCAPWLQQSTCFATTCLSGPRSQQTGGETMTIHFDEAYVQSEVDHAKRTARADLVRLLERPDFDDIDIALKFEDNTDDSIVAVC